MIEGIVSEGTRFIQVPGAHASYSIAALPDDTWAISYDLAYSCGNHYGRGCPVVERQTRDECILEFLEAFESHFGDPMEHDSVVSPSQRNARRKILDLMASMNSGLFGFTEPAPLPFEAWALSHKGTTKS